MANEYNQYNAASGIYTGWFLTFATQNGSGKPGARHLRHDDQQFCHSYDRHLRHAGLRGPVNNLPSATTLNVYGLQINGTQGNISCGTIGVQPTINVYGEGGYERVILNGGVQDEGGNNNSATRFSANLNFLTSEGLIWVDRQGPEVLSGQISGTNITITEPYNEYNRLNYQYESTVLANATNNFTGNLTSNGTILDVLALDTGDGTANHGALGLAANLYFDGTTLYHDSSNSFGGTGGWSTLSPTGNILAAFRTITIGPDGLTLGDSASFTVDSLLTGSGGLIEAGMGASVTITNSGNNYAGGTEVRGSLTATASGSLGTGPVAVDAARPTSMPTATANISSAGLGGLGRQCLFAYLAPPPVSAR